MVSILSTFGDLGWDVPEFTSSLREEDIKTTAVKMFLLA